MNNELKKGSLLYELYKKIIYSIGVSSLRYKLVLEFDQSHYDVFQYDYRYCIDQTTNVRFCGFDSLDPIRESKTSSNH